MSMSLFEARFLADNPIGLGIATDERLREAWETLICLGTFNEGSDGRRRESLRDVIVARAKEAADLVEREALFSP